DGPKRISIHSGTLFFSPHKSSASLLIFLLLNSISISIAPKTSHNFLIFNQSIMFLRTSPSSFAGLGGFTSELKHRSPPIPVPCFPQRTERSSSLVASAAVGEFNSALTGIVFKPFEEVKREEFMVPISPQVSIARQLYEDECESAINEQINVEYNASYIYHSLYAYFDRDNVAMKGFAKFFKDSSEEERGHAEKLMEYQNVRGGRVKLHSILMPPSDFEHVEKGDALYAMELALSLEKLVNEKLLSLHSVATKNNDPQMTEFIEREFLDEQVRSKTQKRQFSVTISGI
ncbi:Ferritin, chloroplastic, partial [Linum perenne]